MLRALLSADAKRPALGGPVPAEGYRHRRISRLRKESGLPFREDLGDLRARQDAPDAAAADGPVGPDQLRQTRASTVKTLGLPGSGKTNTLCAMGHRLVEAGRWELFALTYRVVQQLLAAKGNLDLSRYLRKLDNFDCCSTTWATCHGVSRSLMAYDSVKPQMF